MVDANNVLEKQKEEEKAIIDLGGVAIVTSAALLLCVPSFREKLISAVKALIPAPASDGDGLLYVAPPEVDGPDSEPEPLPEDLPPGDIVVDEGLLTAGLGVASGISLAADAAFVAQTVQVAKTSVARSSVDVDDEMQKLAKQKAEREAKERAEKEAREAAQRAAKEEAERKARLAAEKAAKEAADRAAKEAADKAAKEAAEKAAREAAELATKKAAVAATKVGAKTALTTALKGIPVIGWALAGADVALRAYDSEDGSINVENIGESYVSDFEALKEYGGMWLDDPGNAAQLTGEAIVAIGEDLYNGAVDVFSEAGEAVASFGGDVAQGIVDVGSTAVQAVESAGAAVGQALSDAGNAVGGFFRGLFG